MIERRKQKARRQSSRGATARKVTWSDRGLSDLRAAGDYVSKDNPTAAEKWVGKLLATAENAGRMPLAGRIVPEVGRPDIREVLLRVYRIVYRVKDNAIEVLAVFEGHRLFPDGVAPDDEG